MISSKPDWTPNEISELNSINNEEFQTKSIILEDGSTVTVSQVKIEDSVVKFELFICKNDLCNHFEDFYAERELKKEEEVLDFAISQAQQVCIELEECKYRFFIAISSPTHPEYPMDIWRISINTQTEDTPEIIQFFFESSWEVSNPFQHHLTLEYTKRRLNSHDSNLYSDEFIICWEEIAAQTVFYQINCRINRLTDSEGTIFSKKLDLPSESKNSEYMFPSITMNRRNKNDSNFAISWLIVIKAEANAIFMFCNYSDPTDNFFSEKQGLIFSLSQVEPLINLQEIEAETILSFFPRIKKDYLMFSLDFLDVNDKEQVFFSYYNLDSKEHGILTEPFDGKSSDLTCIDPIDGFVRCVFVYLDNNQEFLLIKGKLLLLPYPNDEKNKDILLDDSYFEFSTTARLVKKRIIYSFPSIQLTHFIDDKNTKVIKESVIYHKHIIIEFTKIQTQHIFQESRIFESTDVECPGNLQFFENDGCACRKGEKEKVVGECELCYRSFFQDQNGRFLECKNCPGDSTTEGEGAKSIDECGCVVGEQFSQESNKCERCPINTYKRNFGMLNCSNCMENAFTANVGSVTCECIEGYVKLNVDYCTSITTIIGISAIVVGSVFGCFVVVTVLFFVGFCILFLRVKKKANRFDHIEGVDMILKEVELEQKEKSITTPTIKLKESSYIINFEEINIIKTIGSGASSSIVYLADWKGIQCAFKGFSEGSALVGSDENTFIQFEREVAVCVGLSHPSIVQFYGASITPKRIGILLQYCDNGDLFSFLRNYKQKNDKNYPLKEKIRVIKEITTGMEYLHSRKLIHRDLKLENVLLDEHEKAKIMDFGLSKTIDNAADKTMTKLIGTVFYMSPEIIKGGNYSYSTDIFSWAILVLTFISEKFNPYGKKSQTTILAKVGNDKNFRPQIDDTDFKDCEFLIPIIKKNWNSDPKKRDTFSQLKEILSSH